MSELQSPEFYEQFKIKSYNLWDLFLHVNQFPYPGRAYAWAKRKDAASLMDMLAGEREEFFGEVLPEWDDAITREYGPHISNLAILCNTATHLHAHLIPRYDQKINRHGIDFIDPNPGKNYAPYPKKAIPVARLLKMKKDLAKQIL